MLHFNNIASLVGNTPLVKLNKVNPNPKVLVLAKLESKNPGGSVKDRAAKAMLEEAEKLGKLKPGIELIEPTQGNTGIALAMMATAKNYSIELAMPENASRERVKLMQAYGAKVTLTPSARQMEGAIDYVNDKMKNSHGKYLMLDQFSNQSNVKAHFTTTGPEIWRDTEGKITHFVSAMGTTGTIMGVSQFLKSKNTDVEIIGAQPEVGSSIPGIRRWPKEYLPKIFNPKKIGKTVNVSETEAVLMARRITREEGILCGVSAGGAGHIAIEIAKKLSSGVVVFIVCDGGDRYLSTDLFE